MTDLHWLKLQSGPVKRACNALEASFVQFPMEKFAMIDKKKKILKKA